MRHDRIVFEGILETDEKVLVRRLSPEAQLLGGPVSKPSSAEPSPLLCERIIEDMGSRFRHANVLFFQEPEGFRNRAILALARKRFAQVGFASQLAGVQSLLGLSEFPE